MNAKSHRSKLVLPTPDTCAWRTIESNGTATCGLLGSLLGGCRGMTNVTIEQCQACCDTFPSTTRRLNPVVASILYSRLCEVRDHGTNEDCPSALIDQLLPLAEKGLRGADCNTEVYLPLRAWKPCCFLGPGIGIEAMNAEAVVSNVTSPQPLASSDQAMFVCRHPAHKLTNAFQCQRCHDWSYVVPLSRKLTLREIVPEAKRFGQVRYWAVGVTTAARAQPTLGSCLQGLVRAGWSDVHLFLDGTVAIPSEFAYLPTTWREQPVGACTAWLLSLAELVALHPQADAYVMFQDDAFVHYGDSLREYLEDVLWPVQRDAIVSLFNPGYQQERGWQKMPFDWDWGTQAIIFPPALARSFLSDSTVLRRALPEEVGQHRPIPELVREWLRRRMIDVWSPSPSVVQHIGVTSSIWPHVGLERHRQAAWFSADFDQPLLQHQAEMDFDESIFQCEPRDQEGYDAMVAEGRARMQRSSVVICGLCRDVRPYLPRTADRIQRLGSLFADYRVVLFENDSIDATREFLKDWQEENARVEVISEELGATKFPPTRDLQRAKALAAFRNRYLERIREKYTKFSHVIIVDTDLVGGWSMEGIANSFGHDNWDFVGSYGLNQVSTPPQLPPQRLHYDRWAFRASPMSPATALLGNHTDTLRRGMPLLAVESCFGGLGLYRLECLLECRYSGEDCEHVALHQRMRDAGFSRLYLNPSQIVLRSTLIP